MPTARSRREDLRAPALAGHHRVIPGQGKVADTTMFGMAALRTCLERLKTIHSTGEAVAETSYCGQLEGLLKEAGKTVSPAAIFGPGQFRGIETTEAPAWS